MAVLLAVALFSVILDHAKGLSASPQHSRYFGLDLLAPPPLLLEELLFDPGLGTPWPDLIEPSPAKEVPPFLLKESLNQKRMDAFEINFRVIFAQVKSFTINQDACLRPN